MKHYRIAASIALGLFFPATSAIAWWQWFHQDVPYAPGPGFWFYQMIPQVAAPGRAARQGQQFQSFTTGPAGIWSTSIPMSSLFVEQTPSPMGYTVRVYTDYPRTQDIEIGVEGRTLVIKKREMARIPPGMPMQMRQTGWSTQWVSLPADANVAALRMSRGNGIVEVFIPRAH